VAADRIEKGIVIAAPVARERFSSYGSHSAGWAEKTVGLARFAEKPAA
jgi:hypothetical protein